jgi:hypothetical protein
MGDSPGDETDRLMNCATRQDALYRFDNLIWQAWQREGALSAIHGLPHTSCRCLILAANGLSFMFSHE